MPKLAKSLDSLKRQAISFLIEDNHSDLIPVLEEMVNHGSAWGMHYLAGCLTYGQGISVNLKKANELHSEAANLGLEEAQVAIGHNLLFGNGVEKDVTQGIAYLKSAEKQGNAFASYLLGEECLNKSPVSQDDYKTASEYFHKATELGEHRAMQRLAWLYSNGLGVKQDQEKALILNIASADLGNETAAFNAAIAFEYGQGTPIKLEAAFHYYEIAAESNTPMALHNLGAAYYNGRGVEVDKSQAHNLYLRAANMGSGLSSFCLARMYEEGEHVSRNIVWAMTWYLISEAQSPGPAPEKIEQMKRTLSEDEKSGVMFYMNAFAEKGFYWAAKALIAIYNEGILCNKDFAMAQKWSAITEQ